MARISAKTLKLTPSTSPDVVGYRMYYKPSAEGAPDYDSAFVALAGDGPWALGEIAELQDLDDVYHVGFTAIDDAGNESDIGGLLDGIPFDLRAPTPPTDPVIT
jgi:hypothetical protein